MKRRHMIMFRLASILVICTYLVANTQQCPQISVDKLFPCLCIQDTNELICRGAEGENIDDNAVAKVMNNIRESNYNQVFKRVMFTQTDITRLDETIMKNIKMAELTMRYNFRLRSISKETFRDSVDVLRNMSFGEIASFFETKAMSPIKLDFLRPLELENLFLSGLNTQLSEELLSPLIKRGTNILLNALYIQCDCGLKWIYDKLSVENRIKLTLGSTLPGSARDSPLACRHESLGVMIPLRALNIADFKNC